MRGKATFHGGPLDGQTLETEIMETIPYPDMDSQTVPTWAAIGETPTAVPYVWREYRRRGRPDADGVYHYDLND